MSMQFDMSFCRFLHFNISNDKVVRHLFFARLIQAAMENAFKDNVKSILKV